MQATNYFMSTSGTVILPPQTARGAKEAESVTESSQTNDTEKATEEEQGGEDTDREVLIMGSNMYNVTPARSTNQPLHSQLEIISPSDVGILLFSSSWHTVGNKGKNMAIWWFVWIKDCH